MNTQPSSTTTTKPVFHDTKGRRRHYFSILSAGAGLAATILLTFFLISVLVNPFLPQIKLKPSAALPQRSDTGFHAPDAPLTKTETLVKQTGDKAKREKRRRDEEKAERAGMAEINKAAAAPLSLNAMHEGD